MVVHTCTHTLKLRRDLDSSTTKLVRIDNSHNYYVRERVWIYILCLVCVTFLKDTSGSVVRDIEYTVDYSGIKQLAIYIEMR